MVWQRSVFVIAAGLVAAAAAVPAQAGHHGCCPTTCCNSSPCCNTEWVSQPYTCTRTCYRTECREETYTAYKCECYPETRTRTCTVWKTVPETRTVTRAVCVCVPTVEERTVMQQCVSYKPVTTTCRRCVDRGHWECRQVPCGCDNGCNRGHRLGGWLKRCFHRNGCCDNGCNPCHSGCNSCCNTCCQPCCQPMKTVRCWVPCPTWEEYPVTCCQRVCECRPVTCKVTVYHTETRQEQCQVTCCKCVPEERTETYQVWCTRKVAYQATRTVAHCVPYQQTVTCCRMVPVQKTCATPCCENNGGNSCCTKTCCTKSCCETTCCKTSCHRWLHRCSGLGLRHNDCCCGN
jgi:hypothetical protein